MILFSDFGPILVIFCFQKPPETKNYKNQANVKAYREFDVKKKNQWNKKDILTFNRLSVPFLSLKCYVDDGSYEVRVSREKMYILYKWIKSKRNTFFPMVNLCFLNQHATNPVENSFVTILLKPSTHNESPYRTNFSQSKSFSITVSTDITI